MSECINLNSADNKKLTEQRRKPGSDLVLILINFRDGFCGSLARTVLAFAVAFAEHCPCAHEYCNAVPL